MRTMLMKGRCCISHGGGNGMLTAVVVVVCSAQLPDFWNETEKAIRRAYHFTDDTILEKYADLGKGGSTAVTAILINCEKLVVANLGDSRAVLCRNGKAKQLSIDHEPESERKDIEERGGFVTKFPGDVARVDGQLAVARAFGDKSIKKQLSSEPDVMVEIIDDDAEFAILASDGTWHVKDVLYHLYTTARGNLQRLMPKEIRIVKYLMIEDPEEKISALSDAFTPGEELEGKNVGSLYTTPEKLHTWIKSVVNAYNFGQEGTLIRKQGI